MADTIVLQFDDLKTNRLSWRPLDKRQVPTAPNGEGGLEQASRELKGWRLLAVIPSSEFFLTKVEIPSKNRQRLIQAIPFTLENDLTEEIDQLHFAHDPKASGRIPIAVVSRERLSAWLERLKSYDLNPLGLYPGTLCLPLNPGNWSIYIERELSLVRNEVNFGFTTDTTSLPILLNQALTEASAKPAQIDLFLEKGMTEEQTFNLLEGLDIPLRVSAYEGDLTTLLADNLDEKHALNILQGDYKQIDKKSLKWRRWLPAAGLFFAFMGVNLITTLLDYAKYEQQGRALSVKINQVFRQAFPEIKRIVDPKVQMQQQLNQLKAGGQENQGDFLSLLAQPAGIIQQSGENHIESISYRDGQLDLKLILKDLQSLDAMKKKIESQNLLVEIRSANATGSQITSHLRIKQGGA
jgi:general secretion pathway protein L